MFKEFRTFIARGNVLDLAVAVIIGAAFGRIVTSLTDDIIRVIEGPLALVPCVSRTAYRRCADCTDETSCAIRRAMLVVRDHTARILDGTSLADSVAEDLVAA